MGLSFLEPDIKPWRAVPIALRVLLPLVLALQVGWHHLRGGPQIGLTPLPEPPRQALLRALAMGDDAVLARILVLWLHAHDTQPGISLPFKALDYERVADWLEQVSRLDPRAQIALLSALRVYGAVTDKQRQRRMLEFVYERFLERPDERWRWLAEAAIVAKHRLRDPDLALRYARALRQHATGPAVPYWARDMEFVVLEDMGELEAARILIGGLLEAGELTDPTELRWLQQKLIELEEKSRQLSNE